MVQWVYMGVGFYASLIVIKYIISRDGYLYVASEMARHGYIEKDQVKGAARHIAIVSSLTLIPFLLPLLFRERLQFFLPYPKDELKHFAEHGSYPE